MNLYLLSSAGAFGGADSQAVLFVAAIVVAMLVLNLFFRLINSTLGIIIAIALILLVLNYVFDISPGQLWYRVSQLPTDIMRLFKGFA